MSTSETGNTTHWFRFECFDCGHEWNTRSEDDSCPLCDSLNHLERDDWYEG